MASAADLVRAMRARHGEGWYRTLSFRQKVTRTAPDGSPPTEEVWYERAMVPGKLRIDFGTEYSGSGVIYSGDSLYVFEDGRLLRQLAQRNALLTLAFDVYVQPPDTTLRQLEEEGFDLGRFHVATFDGRRAYVVGAEEGDMESPQFWIDAERLLFLRMRRPAGPGGAQTSEITFHDWMPLGGGWIAPTVVFRTEGVETMREEYYDMLADPSMEPQVFDPARWGSEVGRR